MAQAYPYALHYGALYATENNGRYRFSGAKTIQIPNITTTGRVIETPGGVQIVTHRPETDRLSDMVTVIWHDRERISPEQRKKAYKSRAAIRQHCF